MIRQRTTVKGILAVVLTCAVGYVLGFFLPVLLFPDPPVAGLGAAAHVLRVLFRLFILGPVGAATAFAIGFGAIALANRRERSST